MKYGLRGQHPLDVTACLVERDVLDPDTRIDVAHLRQPGIDTMRTGIVCSSREHPISAISVCHLAEVEGAEPDIAARVCQRAQARVRQLDRSGHLLAGGGHQLHQANCAGPRARIAHEQTFTSRDAISPGCGNAGSFRVLAKRLVKG